MVAENEEINLEGILSSDQLARRNEIVRVFGCYEKDDHGIEPVESIKFCQEYAANLDTQLIGLSADKVEQNLLVYEGLNSFIINYRLGHSKNSSIKPLVSQKHDLPFLAVVGLHQDRSKWVRSPRNWKQGIIVGGLVNYLNRNSLKIRLPWQRAELVQTMFDELNPEVQETTRDYFSKYIRNLRRRKKKKWYAESVRKTLRLPDDFHAEFRSHSTLFDQKLRPGLFYNLMGQEWFSEMEPESRAKCALLFAYTLNKAEHSSGYLHKKLLVNTIDFVSTGGYSVAMELMDDKGGYHSSRDKKIGIKMFEKSSNLDFLVGVLAHEVSHALSPWPRADSVTYFVEELRAYQVGYLAQYGTPISHDGFIIKAKQLFEHPLYPDMARAWRKNPFERLPSTWRRNNRDREYFIDREKKRYPSDFQGLLKFIGFDEAHVGKAVRSHNSRDLYSYGANYSSPAPLIGRDGSINFFTGFYAGDQQSLRGTDWKAYLNLAESTDK